MIELTTILFATAYCVIQLICLLALLNKKSDTPLFEQSSSELPAISILLAARNEEENIHKCLRAIYNLNYPIEKLQVLIGNDQSEDQTAEIVLQYIVDKPHMQLVNISSSIGKARGKANVLAQLAHIASGDFFLITDADITVNKYWALELIHHFDGPMVGIVSGTTIVHDRGFMGRMQEIDWLYFMGLLKSFANLGLNCTAVGNNMGISKHAYWDVGGYEKLDFSVTEDYKIYKEVRKKGWQTKNILNRKSLNFSTATADFKLLMHQRKRWLTGAKELPFYWWILFTIFGLFTPAVIILCFYNVQIAILIYSLKLLLQTSTIWLLQKKLMLRKKLDYIVGYEYYSNIIAIATQVFYLWPGKMIWKNRKYRV